jgi:Nucleotidyl transferase AbiEii toxin, Type IV TA system
MVGAAARHHRVVLSSLQRRVARLIATLPEADGFALAGGAALVVADVVDRSTRDLDFFGPSPDDVDRLLHGVEQTLDTAGLDVRREQVVHGFARLTVTDGAESTEVDLAADAGIRPATEGPLGPMLSLEELPADKLLALFDRAQACDFVDVDALVARFGLERLSQLAGEKDTGFSRDVLRQMLKSFGRFSADELGIDEASRQRLSESVQTWRYVLAGLEPPTQHSGDQEPGLSI